MDEWSRMRAGMSCAATALRTNASAIRAHLATLDPRVVDTTPLQHALAAIEAALRDVERQKTDE